MARQRYYDFRAPDSTVLFNDRFRAILQAGVYNGFNVGLGGSGGFNLKFTHDADPDNTGEVLGKLVMPDGVMIDEDADQDDVVVGSVSAGTPNIHKVIASYTYNAALPNNDVVYSVLQGTAGSPPTPPVLTDDQIELAEIEVPSGAIAYSSSGVIIKSVQKKDLYANSLKLVRDYLNGVLKAGIYDGIVMSEGSGSNDVTLSSGSWVTKQFVRIEETADQTDVVTITAPASGNHKLSWLIGLHKTEDIDPQPSVDYLLVQGADAALGSPATIPTDATIRAAAFAVSAKYDDDFDSLAELAYINKLGIVRSENRAGTVSHQYIRGETYLIPETIRVYSATSKTEQRSGQYYGMSGLRAALAAAHSATVNNEDPTPRVVELDGEIISDGTVLEIPSRVHVKGINNAKIGSDISGNTVQMEGKSFEWDAANDTIAAPGTWSGDALAGFDRKSFAIEATYQTGDNLNDKKLARGDRVLLYSDNEAAFYEGILETVTGDWTFDAYVEVQYGLDGDDEDLDIALFKTNSGLIDVEIEDLGSGDGKLSIDVSEQTRIEGVVCEDLSFELSNDCDIRSIEVTGDGLSWLVGTGTIFANLFSKRNIVGTVKLTGALSGTVQFALRDQDGKYGRLIVKNSSATPTFEVYGTNQSFEEILVECAAGTVLRMQSMTDCVFGKIKNTSPTGSSNLRFLSTFRCLVGSVEVTDELEINTNTALTIVNAKGDTLNDVVQNLTGRARILNGTFTVGTFDGDALANPDHDKNMRLASDADISWNSTTGELSWDDHIYFIMPWIISGRNRINSSSSPQTLLDEEMLVATIDRDVSGTADVLSLTKVTVAGRAGEAYKRNNFVFAFRNGDVVYLWDGTRVESGQTVQVGSTPPPDGSVTYEKLGATAKAFHNDVFRNYVAVKDNAGWDNQLVFKNTLLRTFTYTAATGVVQYSGTVDLSDVKVGDTIILRNTSYDPTTGGQRAYTREAILAVNDGSDNVTISKGLDPTPGAANVWNGAIVRGNIVMTNGDLVTITYDPDGTNPGRITYGAGQGFSSFQVKPGYLFLDSAGNKHSIIARDTSGSGLWVQIAPGLRTVDTTTPTDELHGAITTNNNPEDLPFADLRPCCGVQFVPMDYTGQPILGTDQQNDLIRGEDTDLFAPSKQSMMRKFSIVPQDPRVRIWASGVEQFSHQGDTVRSHYNASSGKDHIEIEASFAEFTGVFTAIVPVYASAGAGGGEFWIDGEKYSSGYDVLSSDMDGAYDLMVNHYEPSGGENETSRVFRLPLGIHHIRVEVGNSIRGFLVYCHPQNLGDLEPYVSDSPGVAVIDGKEVTVSAPVQKNAIPVPGTGWNKGGRFVRYLQKDGTRSQDSRFIRNHTSTGDVSSGSNTLGNVTNITSWRVGDLLMTINGAKRYMRRVTSISGSSLVCSDGQPNFDYSASGQTIYYYGTSFAGTQADTSADATADVYYGPQDRSEEEVVRQHTVWDFVGGAEPLEDAHTLVFHDTEPTSSHFGRGFRLSDGEVSLSCTGNINRPDIDQAGIQISENDQQLQIWFVGTGISIDVAVEDPPLTDVFVDGIDCGRLRSTELATTDPMAPTDAGGIFIVGNLPYGSHCLLLDATTGSYPFSDYFRGFTVWGPKKPDIVATDYVELLDANFLGVADSDLGVTDVDGLSKVGNVFSSAQEPQIGTINQGAQMTTHAYDSNGDMTHGLEDALVSRTTDFSQVALLGGTGNPNNIMQYTFFGTNLTVMTTDVRPNAGTIDVEILDRDGQWKAPGSTTGFTTTGPVSFTGADATNYGRRDRWTWDEMGVHVIRFVASSGGSSQGLIVDSIETDPPFHGHKTKLPMHCDKWLPFQFSGQDVRNLVPFDPRIAVADDPLHTQTFIAGDNSGTHVVEQQQVPFIFYSRGGLTEITVTAEIADPASSNPSLGIAIMGSTFLMPKFVASSFGVGTLSNGSATVVVRLQAGFHFAYAKLNVATATIGWATWVARQLNARPTGYENRGIGTPLLGRTSQRESSF